MNFKEFLAESVSSVDQTFKVEPTNNGEFVVSTTETKGPFLKVLFYVYKDFIDKSDVKVSMKSGKRLTKSDALKLLDSKPRSLVFSFTNNEKAQDLLTVSMKKGIETVKKQVNRQEQYKATAPQRKKENAEYSQRKRKEELAKYNELYGKGTWNRVTYKQEGGDDGYQYVVRVDGKSKWNGLTQREAINYKLKEVDSLARKEKLGKYSAS